MSEIDRLEVVVEAQAAKANKELDSLIKKLGQVNKALGGMNGLGGSGTGSSNKYIGALTNDIMGLFSHTNKSTSAIKKLGSGIKSLAGTLSGANRQTHSLAYSFGKFYANCFLLIRGVKALGNAIGSSMDYIETYNYFNVTMDKIASDNVDNWESAGYDSAEAYAASFSGRMNDLTEKMSGYKVDSDGMLQNSGVNNLGLDPNVLMNFESRISSITNAVGLVGESSINTSKALTMLSADMSSLFNIDMSSVMTNLQSGLVGQSRALYKYGIDITNATLQTYAYANGISTAVSEMTQSEKMQLRILAILDQSKVSWGDMANTINSAANQWRIFKQQISNVARTLGNLLIPMVQAVLPWINALTMAFQRFLNFIGGIFFGDKWKNIMDGISGGYSDIGDSLGDLDDSGLADVADDAGNAGSALDDANDAAKKLKKTIHSYDELHVATDNTSDSTSGSSTGSTGGGGGIDLSGAIADALADYEKVWNDALNSSANKAQEYADRIIAIFQKMYNMINAGEWELLGAYIAGGINSIFDAIDGTFNWEKLGPKVTYFMNALTSTINSLVDHVHFYQIGKTLGDGLNVITNTLYLWYKGIDWVNIGTSLADGANGLQDAIDWDMLGSAIGAKMMSIPDILYGFVSRFDFSSLGTNIATALNGVFSEIDIGEIGTTIGTFCTGVFDFFINFADNFEWKKFGDSIASGINNFFSKFNASKFAKAINKMLNGILDTFNKLVLKIKWTDVVKGIGTFIGKLDWWAVGKTALMLGIGKFALNTVGSLKSEFVKKMKGFNLLSITDNIATAMANLKAGGLVEGTGLISKLADAFALTKGGAGKLSESLALEFPKISGFVSQIGGVFSGMSLGAVGAIGAVVVGLTLLVTSVNKSRDEMKQSAIDGVFTELQKVGETSLQSLGNVATNEFSKVTDGIDNTKAKISSITETKSSIDSTVTNIEQISTAIENGAYTTSEKVPELINSYQQLLTDSQSIFDQEYDLIVGNVCGAWADILTAQGESVPQFMAQLASLRDGGKEAYGSLSTDLQGLIDQYNNGDISAEDFYTRSQPLIDQLSNFNSDGSVDSAASAIENFGGTLDFSKYINDGSFDTTKFKDYMSTVVQTASDGKTNLETLGGENKAQIEDYKNQLEALGISTSEFDWSSLYGASDQQVTDGIADIQSAYQDFADQVQYCALEQIPGIVESATDEYENKGWWYKLWTTKEEYVNNAINGFMDDTLTPTSAALQDGFDQLGIDAQPWATDAATKMTDAMFDTFIDNSHEGVQTTTTTLKSDWEKIINDALGGASKAINADGYGKDTVTGYVNGVKNNSGDSVTAVQEWMKSIDTGIHDSAMKYGSPSKTAEDYGKFTIQGYNKGISNNKSSSKTEIKTWMGDVKTAIDNEMKSVDRSVGKKGKQLSQTLADGFSENWKTAKRAFTGISSDISSAIGDLWSIGRSAGQSLAKGLSSVYIPTPHIYTSSYSQNQVGNATYSIPNYAVQFYANGGMPNYGEMFMARENGIPEMVGKMGNHASVANNDQIVEGISAGVKRAVIEAMMSVQGNGQQQSSGNVEIPLIVSGEELARAVYDGMESLIRRGVIKPDFA